MSLLGRTYEQLERLGKGGYGQVFKVRFGDEILAAKIFDEDEWVPMDDESEETTASDLALRELAFMTLLTKHGAPHCVPVLDFDFQLGGVDALTIFMPLYAQDVATAIEDGKLSLAERAQVAADVAQALCYLHESSPAIVHRDIKPENVLLDFKGRAHLADFGFMTFASGSPASAAPVSTERTRSSTDSGLCGTATYVAPEYLAGGAPAPSGDVWAAGVMYLELLDHERLSASEDEEAIRYVLRRRTKFLRKRVPEKILVGMLTEDPAERMRASEVLECLRATGAWKIPPPGRYVAPTQSVPVAPEITDICAQLGAKTWGTRAAASVYARSSDLDPRLLAIVAAKMYEHRPLSDEEMLASVQLDMDALEDAQEAFVRQMRGDLLVSASLESKSV